MWIDKHLIGFRVVMGIMAFLAVSIVAAVYFDLQEPWGTRAFGVAMFLVIGCMGFIAVTYE